MRKTEKHQTKAKRIPMALRIGLLLFAVAVLYNGYTLAKYFTEKDQKVPVIAKNFYFESDMLALATGFIPQYTLQAGVDDIAFTLMNYPDELRASEVDINYSVSLIKDGSEIETESGTINAGRNYVSIIFENLSAGTYTVTAVATNPYTQTLKGRFTIVGTDYGLSYNISDASGSPNMKVTVTTTDYSGDVVISWPEGVFPDNTDPLMGDAKGQSFTVAVSAQSEYTFQFFKANPNTDYSTVITVTIPNS